ncbi:helix-hairpin-helix domain-containing protein [Paraliomyxa miuraensis]|nr:helix-hairpin-helix domain-containing protein [Paraliomyxa miuraensis]
MSAALAPEALAPPIARDLGLPEAVVTGVLRLLAAGAQPAFLARFRPERIGSLELRDLEHVQARAAQAVAFELRREQLRQELSARSPIDDEVAQLLRTARNPAELEDVRLGGRKRKRGPAAKARARGLGVLAAKLWACGSEGTLRGDASGPADADPLDLATQHPSRPLPRGQGKGPRKGEAKAVAEAEAQAESADQAEGIEASADQADGIEASADQADGIEASADQADGIEASADQADGIEASEGSTEESVEGSPEPSAPADAADEADPGVESAAASDDAAEAAPNEAAEADPETEADEDEPQTPSPERDLAGARVIVADEAFHVPSLIRRLRDLVLTDGRLRATMVPGKKDKGGRYAKLAERIEPVAKLAPTHFLGLCRGERDGVLELHLEVEVEPFDAVCDEVLGIDASRPCGAQLRQALHEGWMGAPGRAVRASARKVLKARIDRQAIAEICEAYRPLLLAPALGPRPVLAIEPGFEPGCRLAVLDPDGRVVAHDTVYPLQPKLQAPQAKARIVELCREHGVTAIAVTNANGGRDVERLCRDAIREADAPGSQVGEGAAAPAEGAAPVEGAVPTESAAPTEAEPGSSEAPGLQEVIVVSADADAAALFASSRAAKQELPDMDAPLRRAVSAGRRLQDPLTELAKIDPRKLGLGQHQHEVEQEELRSALEQVLVSSFNEVGVDPNRASADVLARISGISHALAKAIVSHREQHGPLRSRQALLDIPGVAGKAFEQAAGFLRIEDGEHALDRTAIHPERYGQVIEMAREAGVTVDDLVGNPELVARLEPERFLERPGASGEPLGRATLDAILEQLRQPGTDPRPPFEPIEFEHQLQSFEDLAVGMELTGVVTHLATFGAFVNVGLPQEGLVHVSELTHGFINSPFEAVHVGQRVRGRVIEVTPERKRFSMSLRALQPRPEGKGKPGGKRRRKPDGERGPRGDRDRDRGGDKDRGPRGDRDDRGPRGPGKGRKGDRGGPRPQQDKGRGSDRVLGFRLDLSELAERLGKE